mmetsp:Transcript_72480/g.212419  ORF Transcript_72480/g.212419 Transcript_72480/m.212419 type:complete len:368 (-) Transcript_72480:27-1130(-)
MRGDNVRAADGADTSVCGKNDDRAQGGFKSAVQIRKALNVKHVNLVDEEHTWHQLCDALIYVPVDDLVDLQPELFCDLCLPGLHEGAHDALDVLAALWLRVRLVQVVQRHVLHHLLLLVDLALGHRHVLVGLEIKLSGIIVAPANSPRYTAVCLDVDDIAYRYLLLLKALVDRGRELQGLAAFGGFQANHHPGDLLAIASGRIWSLFWRKLDHLPFIDLFRLFDPDANGSPAVLHEDFCLLDLRRVDLAAHHGAEGHLDPQLLRYGQGQRRLAGAGRPRHEQGPAGHLLGPDEVHDYTRCLSRLLLAHEAGADGQGRAILVEAEALDVAVGGDALGLGRGLDLLDLHGPSCSSKSRSKPCEGGGEAV